MKQIALIVLLALLWAAPPIPRQTTDNTSQARNNFQNNAASNKITVAKPQATQNAGQSNIPQQNSPNQAATNGNRSESVRVAPVDVHKDWADYLYIFASLALTIATLVIAGIALMQAKAAKTSVEAMINSGRAWILVSRVGNPAEGWYTPNNPNYVPGAIFEFEVTGATPARVIDTNFRIEPIPAKQGIKTSKPDLPPSPIYGQTGRSPEIPEGGRVMPPRKTFQVSLSISLTEQQYNDLIACRTLMCAWGYVTYEDAFGNERTTRTCYVYDFAFGGVIRSTDGTILNPAGFRIGGPPEYNKET